MGEWTKQDDIKIRELAGGLLLVAEHLEGWKHTEDPNCWKNLGGMYVEPREDVQTGDPRTKEAITNILLVRDTLKDLTEATATIPNDDLASETRIVLRQAISPVSDVGTVARFLAGQGDHAEAIGVCRDSLRRSHDQAGRGLRAASARLIELANKSIVPGQKSPNKPRMTFDEANRVLVAMIERDHSVAGLSVREKASLVGCSPGTLGKTKWHRKQMESEKANQGGRPDAVPMTGALSATIGTGGKHDVLEDLISEQDNEMEQDQKQPRVIRRV